MDSKSNIIYPHIFSKAQFKEISNIYCIHGFILGDDNGSNEVIRNYRKFINSLISENSSQTLIPPNQTFRIKESMIDLFSMKSNNKTLFWELSSLSVQAKLEHDNFLRKSNYSKPIDKIGYFLEGCNFDEKLFLGGRKELVIFYCKKFENSSICESLKNRLSEKTGLGALNKIANDQIIMDKFVNELTKI